MFCYFGLELADQFLDFREIRLGDIINFPFELILHIVKFLQSSLDILHQVGFDKQQLVFFLVNIFYKSFLILKKENKIRIPVSNWGDSPLFFGKYVFCRCLETPKWKLSLPDSDFRENGPPRRICQY